MVKHPIDRAVLSLLWWYKGRDKKKREHILKIATEQEEVGNLNKAQYATIKNTLNHKGKQAREDARNILLAVLFPKVKRCVSCAEIE